MTRSILAVLAAAVAVTVVSGTGCRSTGVGDPCVPEAEYAHQFLGFVETEVNVESKSFQCETRLCLANHFRGRVTCPYGQDAMGMPPPGAKSGCVTPIGTPVDGIDPATGAVDDPKVGATVQPQCLDRTSTQDNPGNAVYCSCRCANVDGQTNDGANYCTCPSGFSCTQLISAVNAANAELTGAYCIKSGTQYDPQSACQTFCDAASGNCGKSQL